MRARLSILGLVAVALVVGLFLNAGRAGAIPPVSWQPEPFDVAVPPGGRLPTRVTVTIGKSIPATRVEVTHSLSPYLISIEPETLPTLSAGSEVTLDLIFEVATGTPHGTIEGTLHLRDMSGKGKGTQAQPLPIALTIGDLLYPPDPGEAGKATLEGIDSDGDGLRDDIQRYIQLAHRDAPAVRAGLRQYALEVQTGLTVANNQEASRRVDRNLDRADECLEYFVDQLAHDFTAALRAEMLNTETRSRAYIQYDRNLHGTITNIPVVFDPSACDFDISHVR